MMIRSRAPLRLGLAGGGTDVSPYSELYGGAVLNAAINKYAFATIEPRNDGKIVLLSHDLKRNQTLHSAKELDIDGKFDLAKGSYNRISKQYVSKPLSFTLSTFVDAPPGSGLGSSSTLVVAVIGAFQEWLKLPLGDYDIAHLAYEIERIDLSMAGGKQDQYAATFGGFNYMEFYDKERIIVNPLRIKQDYLNELEYNFLLYNTGTSRVSSKIISEQSKHLKQDDDRLKAMHNVKKQAQMMKEIILKGQFDNVGRILNSAWKYKKKTSSAISNPFIETLYKTAMDSGATGGKISGAGGGGFMLLYCPKNARFQVMHSLKSYKGQFHSFQFAQKGLTTWVA